MRAAILLGCVTAAPAMAELPTETMRAHLSQACFAHLGTMTTEAGVAFVRTPEACFEGLSEWPFKARYVEIDGLRQGYVEAGPEDGEAILMLHGQPSWSYLYRFIMRDLAAAGYRVIAMDHVGFGLSDKPIDPAYHSFQNHVDRLLTFIESKDLRGATVFGQDWGSIIGLYAAGGDLGLFGRMVIGNGGLPVIDAPTPMPEDAEARAAAFAEVVAIVPENQPPFFDADGNSLLPLGEGAAGDPFGDWMAYARYAPGFTPSIMVEGLTFDALTDEEKAAYDAPYPDEIALAGPRTFPSLRNDLVGITRERLNALRAYDGPFLTIFGANDPGLAGEGDGQPWMVSNIPGAAGQAHARFPDASHFLQDDKGPEIARMVDAFLRATSPRADP